MKHIAADVVGILGATVLGWAPSGRAQVPKPTYANLYWEASGSSTCSIGGAPCATGTWDGDIAVNAAYHGAITGAQGSLASMTKDMIDSMLWSTLASPWVLDLKDYGVNVPLTSPMHA